MKPQKDMKDTLRYRNMVANLRSRPAYHQEAMLLKEIAGGKQWRIDAVMDAVQVNPANWSRIDVTGVMMQAAMFGRLTTIENLSEILEFKKGDLPSRPVQAAFHAASLHGHYRVADFLYERGARAHYESSRGWLAIGPALTEGKIRKIDYLLKTGMDVDYALCRAAVDASPEVIKHLLAKGADPLAHNGQSNAVSTALRYDRPALALELLSKVTTLQGKDAAVADAMHIAIDRGYKDAVKVMLGKGAEVNDFLVQIAKQRGDQHIYPMIQNAYAATIPVAAATPKLKTPGL